MRQVHRVIALALAVLLSGGGATVCGGWTPTPDARLACCAGDADCPMHDGTALDVTPAGVPTQAEADACCAASERDRSSQSHPTAVTEIPSPSQGGKVMAALAPVPIVRVGRGPSVPILAAPVPRHVLLSVYLV